MDRDLFQKQLEQLAEIKYAKEPRKANVRENTEPEEILRNGRVMLVSKDLNPSWNIAVKKLKYELVKCQDCGVKVKNRTTNLKYLTYPVNHWRENCTTCRRYKNPETGSFDIQDIKAAGWFMSYFKGWNRHKE